MKYSKQAEASLSLLCPPLFTPPSLPPPLPPHPTLLSPSTPHLHLHLYPPTPPCYHSPPPTPASTLHPPIFTSTSTPHPTPASTLHPHFFTSTSTPPSSPPPLPHHPTLLSLSTPNPRLPPPPSQVLTSASQVPTQTAGPYVRCLCGDAVWENREKGGECSQKCYNMFIVETVCVAWFSLEFVLRFVQARSKLEFVRGPLNIIDAMAILPYYVSLVVKEEDPSVAEHERPAGRGYLDKLGLVLRILRALRILYVMRLARHSLGLQTLGLTVRRSTREFGLLLLFLCVAVTLFSPLVHLAESELTTTGAQDFSSIPASYWWAIISMTTVGYGDMVPRSIPGQVVALSSILSGILIMAFPATSIFHMFSRSYQELKAEHDRMLKEECAAAAAQATNAADGEAGGGGGGVGGVGEGGDGGSEYPTPGLSATPDTDTPGSMENIALLRNGAAERSGSNRHNLPASAF
ncbi:hypothetical protein ACEWY4_010401 [Coilia grayii]|uniref:Ion transport domain-containing protein n=1 Tax=Coilia grayii TaxID=363190 RepID=A0ABD1K1T9_9TELE